MLEYFEQLPPSEQEKIQDCVGQLYRQTFLPERRFDKKAGRLVSNKDYYVCEKHMEFLTAYFAVAGVKLCSDSQLGVIYIQGMSLMGEKLPKLATIYLLLLKLIYDEQMASASSSVHIMTTFGELSRKAGEFRLVRSQPSLTEIRRALAVLKKYQMIESMDALEELNEQTRFLIYPCINLVLMREDIRGLLASFDEEENRMEEGDAEDGE